METGLKVITITMTTSMKSWLSCASGGRLDGLCNLAIVVSGDDNRAGGNRRCSNGVANYGDYKNTRTVISVMLLFGQNTTCFWW